MMKPGRPDRLEQAEAVIASLFDERVAVAVTDPLAPQPPAMGSEAEHLSRAVAKRQREFAAGRAAARRAMAVLGLPPVSLPSGEDRVPLWPAGVQGSISHTLALCAAAVTTEPLHLGLDIEGDSDLNPGLLQTICTPQEIARIAGPEQGRLAKLTFSAKEAAFKAQYPVTGLTFGFDHMEIAFDHPTKRFTATFLKPAGRFSVGHQLKGRFDAVEGHLVTAVMAGQSGSEGA
ncbi:4'-phosphopantetheinyl transferase [Marimonas sp. MJW-29]|uniref:Enterobactin synthase component D n=1 Tax=Sulfitobacter sediminis TaxID=3234186 RepID=A0ABV3RKR7_9RHOB